MASPDVAVDSSLSSTDDQIWDAPTAPDPATPESAPPAEPAADATPAKLGRDDKGRFASADKAPPTAAPSPETAPESPPAESTDEQPPADAKPEAEAEQPPPDDQADYPEFEYTVNGRALSIPGSKVGTDGFFIPAPQQEQVTRLLIAGRTAELRAREHGRELQAAKKAGEVEMQKARAILGKIREAHKADPAAFAEWFSKLDFEKMQLQEENKALRAATEEATAQVSEVQVEQAARDLVPQLQASVRTTLAEFSKQPEFEGVDFDGLYTRLLGPDFDRAFSEDESGEVRIHTDYIREVIEWEAGAVARGKKAAAQAAAALKKENDTRQGQAGVKPPPMPGVGRGSRPATTKPKPYTNTRDADRDIWGG